MNGGGCACSPLQEPVATVDGKPAERAGELRQTHLLPSAITHVSLAGQWPRDSGIHSHPAGPAPEWGGLYGGRGTLSNWPPIPKCSYHIACICPFLIWGHFSLLFLHWWPKLIPGISQQLNHHNQTLQLPDLLTQTPDVFIWYLPGNYRIEVIIFMTPLLS